mgnify:CR=1 FL=1
MKILVCISHVPDTTSKITFRNENKEFEDGGVTFVINPYDEFCLTKAMMLKESNGATVTVLNVGPASTEPTLRKALAIGADDAVRIDAEAKDSFFVAKQIASHIDNTGYDMVFLGRESFDYNGGAVPGMVAELTNTSFVNACIGLELNGTEATLVREIDGGKETLQSSLPIIVAGQKGLVEEKDLRIPSMRGIMMARKKALNVVPAIDSENKMAVEFFELPVAKAACKMISPDNVEELVELLHKEAKVI